MIIRLRLRFLATALVRYGKGMLPRGAAVSAARCRRVWRPVGRHPVRHGSLQWKIPQQVLGRGEVIVPRGGVDLPLAEFRKRLSLDLLRVDVLGGYGQDVIGKLGRPLAFAGSQRVTCVRQ